MYDFSVYELRDLFKIRDAMAILDDYGLANDDMYAEVRAELKRRED